MKSTLLATAAVASCSSLLLACGGDAPPPQTPEPAPVVEPAPAPVATIAPAPAPTEIAGHGLVTCKFEASRWSGHVLHVRTGVNGVPFVGVGPGAKLTASLGANQSEGVFVEAEQGPVALHGYLGTAELPLHAAAAAELKGFLVPIESTELAFVKGTPDNLEFQINIDPKVARPQGAVVQSKPCSFFAIERSARKLDPAAGFAPRNVAIKVGQHELLDEPKGKVSGSITADERSPYASLIARNGSKARIVWRTGEVLVHGWIDAQQVVEQRQTLESAGAGEKQASAPTARKTGVDTWQPARCSQDLKLLAEVDGKRFVVGRVKANQELQLGPVAGSVRGVAFPTADILASDRARLLVEAKDAEACK